MLSMSTPAPVPLAIARSMLSLGIEASRAFWTASASDGFPSGSPPPSRAATVIARASLVKCWPRRASTTAFLCLIECHFECPDTLVSLLGPRCARHPWGRFRRASMPGGGQPRRPAARPQVVERDRVLVGVHALPEPLVAEGAQLTRSGKALERLVLEHAVRRERLERRRLEAEEPAVDPMLAARLLAKAPHDAISVHLRHAERQPRADHGHGGGRAVLGVEAQQGVEVDVGHAVGV